MCIKRRQFKEFAIALFLASVALVLLTPNSAISCWDPCDDDVDRGPNSIDEGTDDYHWKLDADSDGKYAYALLEPNDPTSGSTKTKSVDTWCQITKKYKWDDDSDPEAATFTVKWAGKVTSITCRAEADDKADFSYADEDGQAKVTSADFGEGGDSASGKWMVLTDRIAKCPQNPPDNDEGCKCTASATQIIGDGIEATVTGAVNIIDVFADLTAPRLISASDSNDASDTLEVSSHEDDYDHSGSDEATNTTISVSVYHDADLHFEYNENPNGEIDGLAEVKAKTTVFDLSKD